MAVHRSGSRSADQARLRTELETRAALREPAPLPSVRFTSERKFQFESSVRSAYAANNVVHGTLYRAKKAESRSMVILLHGLGGEASYNFLFPWIARYFNSKGVHVAMIELPFHAQRRPRGAGVRHSFITDDLNGMLESAWQAVADIRGLIRWARAEGYGPIGLWGFSLGSWLGGLAASGPRNQSPDSMVLAIPVAEMKEAVETLDFCAPVREALQATPMPLENLDLARNLPATSLTDILLVQSKYDLFAPPGSVERLATAWSGCSVRLLSHSHISIFFSPIALKRVADWLVGKSRNGQAPR